MDFEQELCNLVEPLDEVHLDALFERGWQFIPVHSIVLRQDNLLDFVELSGVYHAFHVRDGKQLAMKSQFA